MGKAGSAVAVGHDKTHATITTGRVGAIGFLEGDVLDQGTGRGHTGIGIKTDHQVAAAAAADKRANGDPAVFDVAASQSNQTRHLDTQHVFRAVAAANERNRQRAAIEISAIHIVDRGIGPLVYQLRAGPHRIIQQVAGNIADGGRIVDRRDVDGHGVGRGIEVYPATGGAAVILHLEGERGIRRAIGIRHRHKYQVARGNVGHGDGLPRRHRHPAQLDGAGAGQRGDLDRQQVVGRAVTDIGKAEVSGGKGVIGVLVGGHCVVGTGGAIVDRGDVKGDGIGRRVEIDPAVGGAAVVLHLEGEAVISQTVGIGHRGEFQLAGGNIHRRDRLPGGNGAKAGKRQATHGGDSGDLDRQQGVGRGITRVSQAEVQRRQRIGSILTERDGLVRAARCVIHCRDAERHGIGRGIEVDPATGGATVILHLEGEAGVGRAVGVGRRGEYQQAAADVGRRDGLARHHCYPA